MNNVSVKYYLREYLKLEKSTKVKTVLWQKLANISKFTMDWDGESHALSELAILPNISFSLISDSANRINSHFYTNPEDRFVEYKKILLDKVIEVMYRRIREGTPTDYSRLAWLLLSNNQEEKALEIVTKGLELDLENQYCQKIYDKINI